MRVIYLDGHSGLSGDKFLGALVDVGVPAAFIQETLDRLDMGIKIRARKVKRSGLAGTYVTFKFTDALASIPNLKHAKSVINQSGLPPKTRRRSIKVFTRLARAEAHVHRSSVSRVHFHEINGLDTLADIVGSVAGLGWLSPDRVLASPPDVGFGTVSTQHGILPIPAPGTLELLKGLPMQQGSVQAELTTPTGAALLAELVDAFSPLPACTVEAVGYGAGTADFKGVPNLTRLMLAKTEADAADVDEIMVLECDVDDMTGEWAGDLFEILEAAGALDVSMLATTRKKNRPSLRICVLVRPQHRFAVEEALFASSTTFGIRSHTALRSTLKRKHRKVQTSFGEIRIKIGQHAGRIVTQSPEYEDCREAARKYNKPLMEVYYSALAACQHEA